jgi:hypothetical protein
LCCVYFVVAILSLMMQTQQPALLAHRSIVILRHLGGKDQLPCAQDGLLGLADE